VLSLVRNAVDAMPEGGKLTLETANLEVGAGEPGVVPALVPNRYVTLTVRDTGSALDAGALARVFEPPPPGADAEGRLPLATVYRLLQRCGDDLSVSVEPGRGTDFTVFLPLADAVAAPAPTPAPAAERERQAKKARVAKANEVHRGADFNAEARSICLSRLLLTACRRTAGAALSCASPAWWVVFHDRDGDGVRSAGEPGIAGVAVADGREVARTDEAGRYRLPVDDDTILFVIKPSGWRTPAAIACELLLHPQAGGIPPGLHYPGVAPTRPLRTPSISG
jgi:hypothetical protein